MSPSPQKQTKDHAIAICRGPVAAVSMCNKSAESHSRLRRAAQVCGVVLREKASCRAPKCKAIHRIGLVRCTGWRWRRCANMIAAVRIVPMALHLVGGDEQPFSILPATSENHTSLHSDLCRVTVGLVAAGPRWLIRHMPRRIELLVQRNISGRMGAMLLRFRRSC